jgi:hypothetical protein
VLCIALEKLFLALTDLNNDWISSFLGVFLLIANIDGGLTCVEWRTSSLKSADTVVEEYLDENGQRRSRRKRGKDKDEQRTSQNKDEGREESNKYIKQYQIGTRNEQYKCPSPTPYSHLSTSPKHTINTSLLPQRPPRPFSTSKKRSKQSP